MILIISSIFACLLAALGAIAIVVADVRKNREYWDIRDHREATQIAANAALQQFTRAAHAEWQELTAATSQLTGPEDPAEPARTTTIRTPLPARPGVRAHRRPTRITSRRSR